MWISWSLYESCLSIEWLSCENCLSIAWLCVKSSMTVSIWSWTMFDPTGAEHEQSLSPLAVDTLQNRRTGLEDSFSTTAQQLR
jgi:hypothetical protein